MRWTNSYGLLLAASLAHLPLLAQDSQVSEADFLNDVPMVLSVSRLSQRLDEAPGAVTVIDRETIRLSGARDVVELLRWVPGFQVSSSFEADAPTAYYHGAFNEFTSRMQLLIDGRTAYSTYLSGSIGLGLLSVALEDIERIEVLRGSNSATYGARAFLGVVNIITRSPVDAYGWAVSAKAGENGVNDRLARLGWGNEAANFRLTVDERGDDGLAGSNGHNRVRRANLRSDFRLSASDQLQLRAGQVEVLAGLGQIGKPGELLRDHTLSSSFVQIDWRRNWGADQDVLVTWSHTRESIDDLYYYPLQATFPVQYAFLKQLYPQLKPLFPLSYSGTASDDNLSVQYTQRYGDQVRTVLGAELRHEEIASLPLYYTSATQATDFKRIFANMEWRVRPDTVVNIGGMGETSTLTGASYAPRAMVNWHLAPGHTLRLGGTRAYRPTSMFEKNGNLVFQSDGVPLKVGRVPSADLLPERILSREVGYLLDLPSANLNMDVRIFQENISGFLTKIDAQPPFPQTPLLPSTPHKSINGENVQIQGVEYQLKWRPFEDTHLALNQAYIDIDSPETDYKKAAPQLTTSLMWSQRLPANLTLSLMHQDATPMAQPRMTGYPTAVTRTDLRLAKDLRIGKSRAELALVLQNLGGPYVDYQENFMFERRAFVTFRVEN
ncbi:MAG: hypothetical protein RJA34_2453 [Pseudomonadota bacterium]|jgi:iron complex outermembrane receptor protein